MNHFSSQYKTVYQSFKERPKTMLQVSIETGILRANICRYVADMEKKGQIQVIQKGYCPYTHFGAGFYSTDKALFTKPDVSHEEAAIFTGLSKSHLYKHTSERKVPLV